MKEGWKTWFWTLLAFKLVLTVIAVAVAAFVMRSAERTSQAPARPVAQNVGLAPPVWLGVQVPASGRRGLLVRRVIAGSPAHRAGLKEGDVILRIDGARITGLPRLNASLSRIVLGGRANVLIDRAGRRKTLRVRFEGRVGNG